VNERQARILVVDDVRENVRLLEALLSARGYDVVSAADGMAALEQVASSAPDLVLLDVQMPPPDGYEVCRRIRADESTRMLPVVMLTAELGAEKARGLEAGADDFIAKPFDPDELFARVQSLLRIKRYHDDLAELNRTLEQRVQMQVAELARVRRLQRFLSPQLAEAIIASGDESILVSHRREVAMLFADLRGWTRFVDAVEPEELMRVLGEFHSTIGRLVSRFDATVGFLEGDGVQLFFNDPIQIPDAPLRAVRLATELREEVGGLTPQWRKRGHDLDLGIGIALGFATCGQVGFEARSDYAAIGSVTNLASRLADAALGGQILIAQRLYAEIEEGVDVEPVGALELAGFSRPVTAYNVIGVRDGAAGPPELGSFTT
jgi:adenylate cyclase